MIEQYTIGQLLDKYTLFVPEIQRDYVWGAAENYKDVLLPFLQALNSNLKGNKMYNIGFLYSYTNTDVENYIIDGQQRFTSIVLLLYVLSVRDRIDFTRYLRVNEPTMRFTYNVRPQTETFMRRLFESGKVSKGDITIQNWFMPAYSSDSSITSMINAVQKLHSSLDDMSEITFDRVLNNVCFWYFNVDETSQGEELYITMNSRGQKLTESEQIKPHLFNKWQKENNHAEDNTDYGKLWDQWEETFYSQKGNLGISSVDTAMNTFLRIVYEMETGKECSNGIPARNEILSLPLIARYMASMLEYAPKEWPELLSEDLKYRPQGVLKALIAEGLKPNKSPGDTERVERVFRNIEQRRKYQYNHKDLLSFLHSYSQTSESLYDFILQSNSPIFDAHELEKIKIYEHFKYNPVLQRRIEIAFASAEATKVWRGNISPLIRWSLKDKSDLFSLDIDLFEKYLDKFNSLFGDACLKKDEMDIIRRALLAFGLHDYPRIFNGYTNTTFAFEPEDWHKLFLDEENIPKLKEFLDLSENEDALAQLIETFPIEKNYSEFVHIPELLAYCKQKKFQWWWNTIYLISGTNANSAHANIHTYKYYLSRKDIFVFDNWGKLDFYPYSNTWVFMYFNSMQIAFKAMWNGGQKNKQMGIEVFIRQKSAEEIEDILKPIIELDGYVWNGNLYAHYFDQPEDEQQAFLLMDDNIKKLVYFINNNSSSTND